MSLHVREQEYSIWYNFPITKDVSLLVQHTASCCANCVNWELQALPGNGRIDGVQCIFSWLSESPWNKCENIELV